MNSNFFQTILTVLITVAAFASMILVSFGCVESPSGTMLCSASTAPTWLTPYLGMAATGLGFLKLIIAFFQGKLTAPTKVVK